MSLPLRALLREWLRHPWQLALTLAGVALGVAVVVAVDLANVSAEREFLRANGALDGLATHRVSGVAGDIPEELYTRIKVEAGIRDAAPAIELEVRVDGRRLRLIGIDPLSDYRVRGFDLLAGGSAGDRVFPLFLTDAAAEKLGSDEGDAVEIRYGERSRVFHVAGRLDSARGVLPEDVMVSDIAAVQVLAGASGRISHIDLRLAPDQEQALAAQLPPGVALVSTGSRNHARLEMTRAFRINLTALGLLALVIGLFLVYNTVSFQALRRRPLFGLLRAVGTTPNGVMGYLLAEAMLLGVVGSLLGVAAGILLGKGLYALVADTVDTLYYELAGALFEVDPWTLAKGIALGIGATLLAALVPALESRAVPPRGLLVRSSQESHRRPLLPLAAAMLVAAVLVIGFSRELVPAFAGLFLVILGIAALAPALVRGLSLMLAALLARRGRRLAALAARNVAAHLSRTGLATAALSVAVAAALGVALMIDSFRGSVEGWLHDYLRADIYISGVGGPGFPASTVAGLQGLEGVEAVSLGRRFSVAAAGGSLDVFVLDTVPRGFAGFRFRERAVSDPWVAFREGGQVLVSEPLANRHGIRAGDVIELPTAAGPVRFPVAAVYYDYSSEQGVVAMSPATASGRYPVDGYHSAALYIADGIGVESVIADFRARLDPRGALVVRSNRALRDASLEVFDQTFRITGILRLLAVLVAVTGIVSALLALQLERAREYAVLRAAGFTRLQLGLQMLGETALTGLAAGLLAVPLGIALSLLLIDVINLRSFGWTMQTVVDPALVAQSLLLAVFSALLAGLYPAWRLRSLDLARGLRDD